MLAGYDHLLAAGRRLQWDEAAVDLAADRPAARALPPEDRTALRELVAGFCVAEAAVAEHLLAYVDAAAPGVVRACFALQAADEARHARFFARAAREVLDLDPVRDAPTVVAPALHELFAVRLPAAARSLAAGRPLVPAGPAAAAPSDATPGAQAIAGAPPQGDAVDPTRVPTADPGPTGTVPGSLADAVALYHLVLEGLVFGVGQDALLGLLDDVGTLPGLRTGAARVQGDERWHVGLGVTVLHDAGLPADLGDLADLALRAWGPAVATPERVERARRTHERRVAMLDRARVAAAGA